MITMGWACARNGESKCTQDGDGWSDVWKTPKKRWMDAVKEDSYQLLNCRSWEVEAQERDEWRSRIKKAKAHFGL
jgi:hypothetical protein